MSGHLDLKVLLSACVHLSRQAGRIIKEVHGEGQLGAYNKKVEGDEKAAVAMQPDEVLTIADTRAQNAIVTNVRRLFPGIRLVGEEDEEASKSDDVPKVALSDLPKLQDFDVPAQLADSLTLADTCLWIDPLDGTIEFVRNNVHNVCVLIGIAVKDRPVAGVVLQPFVGGDDGTVTYGAVGVGVFSDRDGPAYMDPPENFKLAVEPKHLKDPRVEAGVERLGLQSEPFISQGCGQMLLRVLRGENSAFIQASGASRWDTCAAEALLMAVGAKVTDLDGKPYIYKQAASSYVNSEGLIAARNIELHGRLERAFAEVSSEPAEKRAKVE